MVVHTRKDVFSINRNKKLQIDKKYFKISVYAFVVIALSIVLDKVLGNMSGFTLAFSNIKDTIYKVLSPLIYGFIFAYFLNPLVRLFEKNGFLRIPFLKEQERSCRTLSILLAFAVILGFLSWCAVFFLPDITESLITFKNNLPQNLQTLEKYAEGLLNDLDITDLTPFYTISDSIYNKVMSFTGNIPEIATAILSSTYLAASTLLKVIMGIFISFYMLYEKENFIKMFRKAVYAFASDIKADRFLFNCQRVNEIFENFIVGKVVDSLIIGILCFIIMSLFKLPYTGLISVIVGVTNIIPYFGPFIGAVPAVLIILITDPSKTLVILLIILAIQQFDGNFLGPKILGATVGISPVWIILSIIVGGAAAGPFGMFLGVPVFASARLFINEYIDNSYNKKYAFRQKPSPDSSDSNEPEKKEN